MGRVTTFYYDTNNLLTAINAPGLTSGTTRTLVRLHYKTLTLNYGFSGLTARTRTTTPFVLDAIYYPATATGYWFGDTDSYSSYGMIAKIEQQRGMVFSAASLTVQGTVTQGTVSRTSTYNYPLTPNSTLTDAPTYSTRTDTWDSMNTTAAVTSYMIYPNATPRRVEMALPNGTKSVQLSYNAPNLYNDGLAYQNETYDSAGHLLGKTTATWEAGAYESARPARTEVTNELGQLTATEFDYGTVYNQVTEVRDYDYGGTVLLKKALTQYENSTNYTSRHIFNLVKQVEIYAANGTTREARTEYTYDGQRLADTPGVVQHNDAFNPYAPQYLVYGSCSPGDCPINQFPCDPVCEPDYYTTDYDPATDYRGNVTSIKTYADAVALTGPITDTRRYDIDGNMMTASTSCCEQTSLAYTSATQYDKVATVWKQSRPYRLGVDTPQLSERFYDGLGRVTRMVAPDGSESKAFYNEATRPATATPLSTGPGETTRAVDAWGRERWGRTKERDGGEHSVSSS